VEFTLGPGELSYWNAGVRDFVLGGTTLDLWVGGDSTTDIKATFNALG
jgi:beta-glucosidase